MAISEIKTIAQLKEAQSSGIPLCDFTNQITVLKDLEKYLEWLDENSVTTTVTSQLRRDKKRAKGIHPSSACKSKVCLKSLYYGCTFEIEPSRSYNQENQLTWDLGTIMHCLYQEHFHQMYGSQFRSEVGLKDDELMIKSHTDGLFEFSNVRFVLEMKTIKEGGNFGWQGVQDSPMEDNVRQAHFYMKLADAPFGLLLYINKNRGLLKEHPLVFDEKIWDGLKTNVVEPVLDYTRRRVAPEGIPGFHCRYCDYSYGCPDHAKHLEKGKKKYAENFQRVWGDR